MIRINYGVRPAILKRTRLYILNQDYTVIGNHPTNVNTLLIDEKTFMQHIGLYLNKKKCSTCDIDDILKAGNMFFCFSFEFSDPFITYKVSSDPIFFKWIQKNRSDLVKYTSGDDSYYTPDICTNTEEIAKIKSAINKTKNLLSKCYGLTVRHADSQIILNLLLRTLPICMLFAYYQIFFKKTS